MGETIKRFSIILVMTVLVISLSIPFVLFPSKVYADSIPYEIGDTGPAGGIICYVNGSSYLEAAPSDIPGGVMIWTLGQILIGTSTALGTGQENTTKILAQESTAPAAKACNDLVVGAYDDWFLPSLDELHEMWESIGNTVDKRAANGFTSANYWSSSESDQWHASYVGFWDGSFATSASDKFYNGYRVRAIRTFSVPVGSTTSKPLTPQEQVLLNLSLIQQADLYGGDNAGFIKTLYDNVLGRVPDEQGLNEWVMELNNGKMTPGEVVYNFVFSDELKPKIALMGPEEFATFLYKNVFNRDADSDGYNNWVSLMKNGMSKEDILLLFLNGNEFKNICTMFGLMQ